MWSVFFFSGWFLCARTRPPRAMLRQTYFPHPPISANIFAKLSREPPAYIRSERKKHVVAAVWGVFFRRPPRDRSWGILIFFRCYIGNGSRQLWKSILTDTDGCKWLPCRLPFDFQKFPLGSPPQKYFKFSVISVISVHSRRRQPSTDRTWGAR